ncbi:hypothetical protein CMQ_5360 [Grosmannia clavigera kw1407]|uniref:Protein kinase domain-containing protein n=1 Tax=Grosmannia clavigera (strain kw1407 / UAMH 11150) TaxID=655863 RepID=F0XBP1_GROCL|nr:uncharacterized protein CMQ_5360 [Grosmannia clavigera kw1407]EFX05098.1 hypothetical protein CMQ_5360 [Grosmannia clavigera kw1407]
MASSKNKLNVDSPVFTPGSGQSPLRKTATLSMQAAAAIPFTPRGSSAVSTSNASSAASPREQLRDLIAPKDSGQMLSRGDVPAFNVATAREFVPRSAERTPPNYNVALAREFLLRGDRSPFNIAQAVEFRPVALSSSAASSAAPIHTLQSSPETTQQSLQSQHTASTNATPAAAVTNSTASQPPLQAPTQPAAHMHIPTGPAQSSQISIPTGPSRGSANSHASSGVDGVSHITSGTRANSVAAAAAAAASMAGLTMAGLTYGLGPGADAAAAAALYDSYSVAGAGVTAFNPYAAAAGGAGREGAAYFQSQPPFGTQHQPLNEHLYFPQGPHRQDLLPRQRTVHDFFLPEKLRQDVHMKSRAGSQAALTLSVNVESYHSLTPLDTNSHKVAGSFGRITWLYKAVASKNGKHYCLRRLENFRVSNENALRAARDWRRVSCGSVVTVHEAFTTRAFGDSSVVFATDYYPLSVTLMQYHFPTYGQNRPRGNVTIQETILWGYFVQITNALRAIHSAGLAARSIDLTKIIRTGKNRIRLSGCAVQDVINYDPTRRVSDLQQDDFVKFGEVMLALAMYTPPGELKQPYAPMEQIPEIYSHELKEATRIHQSTAGR